jgi:hypothetical protein
MFINADSNLRWGTALLPSLILPKNAAAQMLDISSSLSHSLAHTHYHNKTV